MTVNAHRAAVRRLALLALAAMALFAAGCGDDDNDKKSETTPTTTTKTASAASTFTAPAAAADASATKDPKEAGLKALAKFGTVDKAGGNDSLPRIQGSQGKSVFDFEKDVFNDAGGFWQDLFNKSQIEFPKVQVAVIGPNQQAENPCSDQPSTTDSGPSYCPQNSGFYLPQGFFEQKLAPIGDTAVAFMIAHLWGHRVEDLLGAYDPQNGFSPDQIEQTADCLGGIWLQTAQQRQLLEEGDIEEASALIAAMNDGGADDPSTPAGKHLAAFKEGFTNGSVKNCNPGNFS